VKAEMSKTTQLALDPGNYQIKACDSNGCRAIRSVQYKLPKGVNALKSTPASPVVEIDGTLYHVGFQALKYRSQEQTMNGDKSTLAKLHFYAACPIASGNLDLIVSHHSPDTAGNAISKALTGKHSFKKNSVQHEVNVSSIRVVSEGVGAYWQAKKLGLVPETGYTIVIDLGGSTWLYRVIDADGDVIDEGVGDRLGTVYLACQIAADDRLKAPLRKYQVTSPNPGSILDGFAMSHTYEETGIGWGEWFSEYLDPWFKQILGQIQVSCTPHLPKTRRFLITGGGAHLVAAKISSSPLFKVMPQSEFANVQGMYLYSANPFQLAA
jgi:Actin like proteins N terminal domain